MMISLIDCETTGLDSNQHEILEIGAIVFDTTTFEVLRELNVKVKPSHIETADQKALEVNGYTEELWADAVPLTDALTELSKCCGQTVFMSYNVTFDWPFVDAAYRYLGARAPFQYFRLDAMTIAWSHVPDGNKISLKAVCEYLNIPPEPTVHRALNGARAAFEVIKKIKTNNHEKTT